MLATIRLFGRLAETCGPGPFRFDVATLGEVVSALHSQFDGIDAILQAPHLLIANGKPVSQSDLGLALTGPAQVRLVPCVHGAGGGSFLNYAGGLASVRFSTASRSELMGVAGTAAYGAVSHPASLLKGAQGAYEYGGSQLSGSVEPRMARWGTSALLTGFTDLPPGTDPDDPEAIAQAGGGYTTTRRAVFTGEAPTITEGGPVPIRFGRQMVTGMPISVKMTIVQDLGGFA